MKYLFVGCHPDDIEISAMGYLLKLIHQGHEVGMLVLSGGQTTPNTSRRWAEQQEVYNLLKQRYMDSLFCIVQWGFPDGQLTDYQTEIQMRIEEILEKYQVDAVITHYPEDTHRDHRGCSQAVTDAARKITTIYFESVNSRNFTPNLFVELHEKDLQEKLEYARLHVSQMERSNNYYLKKIEAAALFRGSEIYRTWAEAFHILREIEPL